MNILVVEDDKYIREKIKARLSSYKQLVIYEAKDAGEALDFFMNSKHQIDALVLDIMMPYRNAAEILKGTSDPQEWETGIRILKYLRGKKKKIFNRLWIAVITARTAIPVLQEIQELVGRKGRVYPKPFDSLALEADLATVLGFCPNVPEELLPSDYEPPVFVKATP